MSDQEAHDKAVAAVRSTGAENGAGQKVRSPASTTEAVPVEDGLHTPTDGTAESEMARKAAWTARQRSIRAVE